MVKKRLVTVRVTEREYQWLIQESESKEMSISEAIRDLIRQKVDQK